MLNLNQTEDLNTEERWDGGAVMTTSNMAAGAGVLLLEGGGPDKAL